MCVFWHLNVIIKKVNILTQLLLQQCRKQLSLVIYANYEKQLASNDKNVFQFDRMVAGRTSNQSPFSRYLRKWVYIVIGCVNLKNDTFAVVFNVHKVGGWKMMPHYRASFYGQYFFQSHNNWHFYIWDIFCFFYTLVDQTWYCIVYIWQQQQQFVWYKQRKKLFPGPDQLKGSFRPQHKKTYI